MDNARAGGGAGLAPLSRVLPAVPPRAARASVARPSLLALNHGPRTGDCD